MIAVRPINGELDPIWRADLKSLADLIFHIVVKYEIMININIPFP